ncbi:hypothetical protein AJ79_09284 [Helicocarpus griseus UAMH5409]|uniref:FAD/NAD(P)-binding domain-containing protein n=1 Tax=Helicocarpus griseus UAMH5409 TaxID=1447875 RepID=A0A2B7WL29_9EURO|nr:hypothetical protein AJ79_09284 [Helicocarpus griseus UAMH5409]
MAPNKYYPQLEVGNKNYTEAAVVIIGAGISGICTAINLLNNNIHNFVIVEKSGGLGGTWRDNKYPGCCCDINSHLYSYSFEQNPNWSRLYPGQEEMLRYLHTVAEKYKLFRYIRFNSSVKEARWDGEARKWKTAIEVTGSKDAEFADHYTLNSDFLVSAVGQLNSPYYPSIPGIEEFQGKIIHTSRWDWTYDYKGKRIGIIGNGATAAQVIPSVAPDAAQLTVFQRTPNWLLPRYDAAVWKPFRLLFKYFPFSLWKIRAWMMDFREAFFTVIQDQGSGWAAYAQKNSIDMLKKQIPNRPDLWEKLVPNYPVGCKRVIVSDDYYPTFTRDNVTLETNPIEKITKNGITVEGGIEHEFDLIVLATGFRTVEFMHPIQLYGANGRALSDIWRDGAHALYGVTVDSLPNFAMLYGPNTNLGHNSIILMIESQAKYIHALISQVLEARQQGQSLAIMPNPKRTVAFNEEIQETLGKTSFAHPNCRSWYKRADGKITNNWSSTVVEYQKTLSKVDWTDFILEGYGAEQLATKKRKTYLGRVREESLFTYRDWVFVMAGLLGTWGIWAVKGKGALEGFRSWVSF